MTNEEAFEKAKPILSEKAVGLIKLEEYKGNMYYFVDCGFPSGLALGYPVYVIFTPKGNCRFATNKERDDYMEYVGRRECEKRYGITFASEELSLDEFTHRDMIRLIQLAFDSGREIELQYWGSFNEQKVYNILYEDCNYKPYPPHLVLIDNDKNCRFADEEETKSLMSAHLKDKRNAPRPKPQWDVVPPEMRFKEKAEIVEESPKLTEAKNRLPKLKFFKECHLAAMQYYDADLVWNDLKVGSLLRLVRDEDNRFDSNAVAVMYDKGRKYRREEYHIGYIPSSENKEIATFLEMGWDNAFECRISKITPDAHYENQIRLTIRIRRNEDE